SAARCGTPCNARWSVSAGSWTRTRNCSDSLPSMFVFKAAVVGAAMMRGPIAQVIASADIPVVLKDVDQKFIDQGLEKARQVTEGQLQGLVKKEKITEDQAKSPLGHRSEER